MALTSSDEDGADLMASFKKDAKRTTPTRSENQPSFSPSNFISDQSSGDDTSKPSQNARQIFKAVVVSPIRNKHEYIYWEPRDDVQSILREYTKRGETMYEIKLTGGASKQVTFEELLDLDNGLEAFHSFEQRNDGAPSSTSESVDIDMRDARLRSRITRTKKDGYIRLEELELSSDDELVSRKSRRGRIRAVKNSNTDSRSTTRSRHRRMDDDSSDEVETDENGPKRRKRKIPQEPTRRSARSRSTTQIYDVESETDDDDDASSIDVLRSDPVSHKRKRGRPRMSKSLPEKVPRLGTRQSGRATRAQNNMQEAEMDDIYRSDSEPRAVMLKIVNVKETFETLPRTNPFRSRHVEGCEVCREGPNVAPLIYCQGCSLAYHKNCLGSRSTREHLVTKVDEDKYVLQCRRCINIYKKRDSTAPDLSMCQDCRHVGPACEPFRSRKTTQQEQKDRDENNGLDPVVDVPLGLLNDARNVLFRCTKCARAWHYHHLPPLDEYIMDISRGEEETADERFTEYSKQWTCKECEMNKKKKVAGLIAWRPSDVETYLPGTPCDRVSEDDKQYLIKWDGESYFQVTWFSGAWTWGVTAPAMRKAFFKREDGPKMRTEDAIPEEFLRIDIVLDIKYTSYVEIRSEEIDKARIKEVDKALIKYKGLGYEDAVWEKVPTPDDGDRWLDFVTAYDDWVAGRYVRFPKQGPLKARMDKARTQPFAKLEKQKQPDNLVGGELMKYQIEGLNWLYFQWYSQRNGILADEMGLGKTIQIIAFMATLIEEHSCFPFLVVVPNSTCANWRREIKQWVPTLRVVTFFGSSAARDMASKYEMFPEGSKELRAHIVVTSYEASVDDSAKRLMKRINWAGLIVDEGQRLKNDKSLLYNALNAVRAPFRVLLTGTPLQNNARELFNLIQFLDDTVKAAELEEKYAEMSTENIRELHDQIRPYILRRTKVQVLTFLPPLGQIIVPLSMSVLQKSVYKSILARNPELLKALFTNTNLKTQERANLSNILMQLRKCLCHPFVYSREIEERTDVQAVSHRNLVEASAKLQLLELLLPKLKERGHRVLIFSQFLDMLAIMEDFLDGMQMAYQRLDGTMGSLEKQKRIDQFNAPDSPLFAFLLSTRAGGVGINLATADTVIILDPDFNPHQDIQAISRAHRIGQKKKVLCFQLMTRTSVEEKIIQMGRKKMVLDHVVVEQLDAEDIEDKDVQSILKFGAAELFKDQNNDQDIRYDEMSIEKLLDRSQIENTKTSGDDSAESQFSFARVWANDQGTLEDALDVADDEVAPPDPGVWDKILKERKELAATQALARAEALGRGKRARINVDYVTNPSKDGAEGQDSETELPTKPVKPEKKGKKVDRSADDTDFKLSESEGEETASEADDINVDAQGETENLQKSARQSAGIIANQSLYKQNGAGGFQSPLKSSKAPPTLASMSVARPEKGMSGNSRSEPPRTAKNSSLKPPQMPRGQPVIVDLTQDGKTDCASVKPFERSRMPIRSPIDPGYDRRNIATCPACRKQHLVGACELKVAGVEHCGLCGLAHYGHGRTCPHIRSETQVREMLLALKNSPEDKELVDAAVKYLRGVKGALVQQKKKDRERATVQTQGGNPATDNTVTIPSWHPRQTLAFHGHGETIHGVRSPAPPAISQENESRSGGSAAGNLRRPPALQGTGATRQPIDDHQVESALRNFLGS